MIDRTFATKQIQRLQGLSGFPRAQEAMTELVKALETAQSYTDAQEFVDSWLRNQEACPKPTHIYQALAAKAQPESSNPYWGKKPPIVCKKCGDNGPIWNDSQSKWERCTCANGVVYPENLLRLLNGPNRSKHAPSLQKLVAGAVRKPKEGAA